MPFANLARASGEKGNGGDAVVCRDDQSKIISAEPLDVYEARKLRQINVTGLQRIGDTRSAFNILLDRLGSLSPVRAGRFRSFFENFQRDQTMTDGVLVDIPDSEHLSYPRGCAIEQLIIQRIPETPFDRTFLIQKSIWARLTPVNQAIMIMHEAFLSEAIANESVLHWETIQTRGLRYVNSLLFGFDPSTHSVSEKTFISGLALIPNFYLAESKTFGEFIFRTKLRSVYLNTILDYDDSGEVSNLVLIEDPVKGRRDFKIGLVQFHSEYNSHGDRYRWNKNRVRKIDHHLIQIDAVQCDWNMTGFEVSDAPTLGARIDANSAAGIQFTDSFECDLVDFSQAILTVDIRQPLVTHLSSNTMQNWGDGSSRVGVPIGLVRLLDRSRDVDRPIEMSYDSQTRILTYQNSGRDRVIKFKSGTLLSLEADFKPHQIRLNSDGTAIEVGLNR